MGEMTRQHGMHEEFIFLPCNVVDFELTLVLGNHSFD